jgi:hypothetical protein
MNAIGQRGQIGAAMQHMQLASAPEPEREREVQASMSQLSLHVSALDDSVSELLRRLSPVMRQEPAGKSECTGNPSISTPLADGIQHNAYRVSGVNDNVRHILHLLEV